jgi:hypothetical protein
MPPKPVEPIAKQKVGDTQEIEKRRFGSIPGLLFGVGTIVHAVPSHMIANVLSTDEPSTYRPTAAHDVADVQLTDERRLESGPSLGLTATAHALPFHVATRV